MGSFAWRNLLTRPLRTVLALVGLSIPILGVMGLFSVSGGLKNLVGDTLSQVKGMMVIRENQPSPVFSDLKADMRDAIKRVPGVARVAPEVWKIAPGIEGQTLVGNLLKQGAGSILDQPVIQGQDIAAHRGLKSAVYPKALKEGRFLSLDDKGTNNIVVSRKFTNDYPVAKGQPRRVGDTLHIGEKPFKIVGIYETGSMLLDVVIVMDIDTAREVTNFAKDRVSSFYVETENPERNEQIAQLIKQQVPGVEARSMEQFTANFTAMMGQVDKFLMMTVSLALVVGVVGIINTMLMSTSERFVEFGVLRTNGWTQQNILSLVTLESAYLGVLAGVAGSALAVLGVAVANQFLSGGIHLTIPLWLFALGMGLSIVTGTLGGLYPAWRAARLVPMDAIRIGSH